MFKSKKKEFILEGLCCANCAAKIEDKIGKINGITKSSVNFKSKTLTVKTEESVSIEDVMSEIKSIVTQIEPDAKIKEKV